LKKLLLLLAVSALVLAACGSGSGVVAATVDETDITVGDVEMLMDSDTTAITKEQFAQFLTFEIQWVIIDSSAADQYGISFTDEEVAAEADRIYEDANNDETREDFLATRGVTEEFLFNIARQGLTDLAVREELAKEMPQPTQEEINAEMDVAVAGLTQVCVSHVLVETLAEAQEVMGRLDSGEDFGAIAMEVSLDPGSGAEGGVLPCGPAGQYVEPFRDAALIAPVGEVYAEIVESDFGFHVLMVTDRVEPTEDGLPTQQEIIEQLNSVAVGQALNDWFLTQVGSAVVVVDEEYGTWQGIPEPQVIPPSA
jgi:foldase protein PrsA